MQLCRKNKSAMDNLVGLFNNAFINKNGATDNSFPKDTFSKSKTPIYKNETDEQTGVVDLDLNGFDLFDSTTTTETVANVADGLVASLNTYGKVDVEYIAKVTAKTVKEVVYELFGSIYQNPEKFQGDLISGWETADEYLSGNVGEKLRIARIYNVRYNGYFTANVKALQSVLPRNVNLNDIHATLGAPWIPVYIIEDFIRYLTGARNVGFLKHDELTGSWEIKEKSYINRVSDYAKVNVTFGTYRMDALSIIEKTLNVQTIKVLDEKTDFTGKKAGLFCKLVNYLINNFSKERIFWLSTEIGVLPRN